MSIATLALVLSSLAAGSHALTDGVSTAGACVPSPVADVCPGMHEGCMGIHVLWRAINKAPDCYGQEG